MDALETLSFSVSQKPGLFAVLVGSGVSRSSGIMTGWDITLDLIKQIALLRGESHRAIDNPAKWYRDNFAKDPNYSTLLKELAPTKAERNAIIRKYFEPNSEAERDRIISPQKAHLAIAQLVAKHYVSVIITTNFDRLIESALEFHNIGYTSVSVPDQAKGAMPLVHENCTLIKVNGDYRNIGTLNTREELSDKYPVPIAKLIRQVFEEYGLIICGWSAEYDVRLRRMLERHSNLKFPIYWTIRPDSKESKGELIRLIDAQLINISDADSFFSTLRDNVMALEKAARIHPLSIKMAEERTKRYLSDERYSIDLHDLVVGIVQDLSEVIEPYQHEAFPDLRSDAERVAAYVSRSEMLSNVLAIGCYHCGSFHHDLWVKAVERIVNSRNRLFQNSGDMRGIVALIIFYACGIAALAAQNYELLKRLFFCPFSRHDLEENPLVLEVYPARMMEQPHGRLPAMENGKPPVTLHGYLFDVLRKSFRALEPYQKAYLKTFNRFEYFTVLIRAYIREEARHGGGSWAGVGMFARTFKEPGPLNVREEIAKEIQEVGDDWPPLKVGLFGGSRKTAEDIKERTDAEILDYIRGKRDIYEI